jgi:uridylate kinase
VRGGGPIITGTEPAEEPAVTDDLPKPKYKRILLKMSGEAFGHGGSSGISIDETLGIARQIHRIHSRGVQVAVVVGGGNILRGAQFSGKGEVIKEATAHYMGMLATLMNGLALQEVLEGLGVQTRLQTALRVDSVAEFFIRRRAVRHLEKGRVLILGGGTGNPYVTTDTAAALRGIELEADILLKATRVDRLTYDRVFKEKLRVMDLSAIEMCENKKLPVLVFNYKKEGNLERAVAGQDVGTLVTE